METVNRDLIGVPRRTEDPFPSEDKNEYLMELYQLEDKLFEIDRQIHEINYCEKEIESIAFCLDECSLMGEIDLKISRLFRIGVIKIIILKAI